MGRNLKRFGHLTNSNGRKSDKDAAVKAALDVAPLFGKGIGKAIGKWINPNSDKSIDAALDVFEHQKGLIEAGKGLLHDPNR